MFPTFTPDFFERVKVAIDGRREFIIAERGPIIVVDYVMSDSNTFPEPDGTDRGAVLRECRGLKFDAVTHQPVSRGYHKFFNVGEKAETFSQNIDLTRPHLMLEKLDGSCITAYRTSDGVLRWGTMMGETDVAEQTRPWLQKHPNYIRFATEMVDAGFTPIFEWCSRRQSIVIDYPVERLVLTGIRHIITGEYVSYDALVSMADDATIDVVQPFFESNSLDATIEYVKNLKDAEGLVIRFDDGKMVKMKADDYLQRHKILTNIASEKDVFRGILTKSLDDIKPRLPVDVLVRVEEFEVAVTTNLTKYLAGIENFVGSLPSDLTRKEAATTIITHFGSDGIAKTVAFKLLDGHLALPTLMQVVLDKKLTSAKMDELRHIIGGAKYNPRRSNLNEE